MSEYVFDVGIRWPVFFFCARLPSNTHKQRIHANRYRNAKVKGPTLKVHTPHTNNCFTKFRAYISDRVPKNGNRKTSRIQSRASVTEGRDIHCICAARSISQGRVEPNTFQCHD